MNNSSWLSRIPRIAMCLATLCFLVAPRGAEAQDLKKIKITIPVPAFGFYPLYVGVDQGYFAKEGYDVEIISTAGDGPDVDALISGSVEFAMTTPNRLLTASQQGKPLLAVMTTANRMGIECLMNKTFMEKSGLTLETPLDDKLRALKGQVIAGTRPGAFTYLTALRYLKRVNLEPQKDVKVIGVGGPASMLAALENGQVVLACTASPTPETAEARGKSVQITSNLAGEDPEYNDFMYQLLYTRPDYAKQNPEVVRGIIRGLLKSIAYLQDTPADQQMPKLRERFTGIPDDVMLKMLKNNQAAYKRDGVTTKESVDKVAAFLRDSGALNSTVPDWKLIATNEYLPNK